MRNSCQVTGKNDSESVTISENDETRKTFKQAGLKKND